MSRILLAFLALIAQAADGQVSVPNCGRSCIDEANAASIAEKEFLKFTHREITRYSIRMAKQDDVKWLFVVDKSDLPGPGDQWFIEVERTTGKVLSISRGE